MKKLKQCMRRYHLTSFGVSRRTERRVSHQQVENLVIGRTEPWNVRVSTAQALVDAFPGRLRMRDFFKPAA